METRNEIFFLPNRSLQKKKKKERKENPFIIGREQWKKFKMEFKVEAVESIDLKKIMEQLRGLFPYVNDLSVV